MLLVMHCVCSAKYQGALRSDKYNITTLFLCQCFIMVFYRYIKIAIFRNTVRNKITL